ncbi:MAG: hypothetical protein HQK76_07870 [Desulfobacterales bacterium]|nr:hypothetical protein [Desulfobacterales bacterium]
MLYNLLSYLYYFLPYMYVSIFFILLFLFIAIVKSVRAAKKQQAKAKQPTVKEAKKTVETVEKDADTSTIESESYLHLKLRNSFSSAINLLKKNVSVTNYRYIIPWYMVIGEQNSGKTTMLFNNGLNIPFGRPSNINASTDQECRWFFFEKGIVLDIAGNILLSEGLVNSGRWNLLLRLLQKYRPKKPIDGIILTIPCSAILNIEGTPEEKRLSQKAEYLYHKLWEIQRKLGIRFPVYILITKCDSLDGFQSLCKEIPGRLKSNMIGWSSPYSVDAGYSSYWVDEAFNSISQNIFESEFSLFAEGTNPSSDNESLFLLHRNFYSMLSPLRVYIDKIFRENVYHESFIFRGIYFSGDSCLNKEKKEAPAPFFLKDLFEKKIFPEFRLARPIGKKLVSRNQMVIATQVIAFLLLLIWGGGLFSSYRQLQEDKIGIISVLEEIEKYIENDATKNKHFTGMILYEALRKDFVGSSFEENAAKLLEGISNISDLKYIFIPSSWFPNSRVGDDIHEKITKAVTLGYDTVIIKALYIGLVQKAKYIFETSVNTTQTVYVEEIFTVDETEEFKQIEKFVAELKVLEDHSKLYNNLNTTKNINDIAEIVKYLFDITLPKGFQKNSEYYFNALKGTQYKGFDPTIFQIKARTFTLKKLTKKFIEKIFEKNPVRIKLYTLSDQFKRLSEKTKEDIMDDGLINDIHRNIVEIEKMLNDPKFEWMSKQNLDLGEPFNKLISSIDVSMFLGPNSRLSIVKKSEEAFKKLKKDLIDLNSAYLGNFIYVDSTNRIKIAPKIVALNSDLEKLIKNDFVTKAFDKSSQNITPHFFKNEGAYKLKVPDGYRLMWDIPLLKGAVAEIKPYEKFIETELPSYPKDFQGSVKSRIYNNMNYNLSDVIDRSQNFILMSNEFSSLSNEVSVRTETKNFKEAAPLLNQLLVSMEQQNFSEVYLKLSGILYWQTTSLLKYIDSFLEKENLYSVKVDALKWQNVGDNLHLATFKAADEDELKKYLEIQRQRIAFLADQYAKPIVAFLLKSNREWTWEDQRILFKWERIISELEKYEAKKPSNSLTDLETFIISELKKFNDSAYVKKINIDAVNDNAGDYFQQKKNGLIRIFYEKNQIFAAQKAFELYKPVQQYFNSILSGKYPFSDKFSKNSMRRLYYEATIKDILDFYKIFDAATPYFDELKTNNLFGLSGPLVYEFVDQMKKVRKIFEPCFGSNEKEQKLPEIDFDIEFRVYSENEISANQIIDWQLSVDKQTFKQWGDKYTGKWVLGNPVNFELRWAKNSYAYPISPISDKQPYYKVENKSALFEYSNLWSLISLIKEHNVSVQTDNVDYYTLKFVVNTVKSTFDKNAPKKEDDSLTQSFIRITPFTQVKLDKEGKQVKKELLVIPDFPKKAPDLAIIE